MSFSRRAAGLLMAAFLAVPSIALAEDEESEDRAATSKSSEETPVVTVTATRTEKVLNEVPISVTLVDQQELRRNPALDVPTQLSKTPGVQVHGQTGTRRVMIRGMTGSRTLILVDGVKQPELRGIDGSFYNIDPSNIERIEVIKGPASVLYGSDAIGGVVNIITKKGSEFDKPISLYAGLTFDGSTASLEPRLALSGRKSGFNYRLSGSGIDAGDRDTPEGKLWHSAFTQREYAGNFGYDWDKGGFNLSFDNYQGTGETIATVTQGDGLLVPTDPWRTPTITTVGETPRNDRTGYNAKLDLYDLSANLKKLTLSGFYQQLKRESDTIATFRHATHAAGSRTAKTYNDHDSLGGSLQSEWLLGADHYVILGLDYDKSEFDSTGLNYSASGAVTSRDLRAGYQETFAVFGQDEWSLTDHLAATLGLRYTSIETALTRYSSNPGMLDSSRDSKVVGSLGLVYSGIEDFYFRALYSQGYRNGNLLQKFMGSGTFMLANPELKPETSDNYELGLRYDNGRLNLDLALFYNDLTDGLAMVEVGNNVYQYINYSKLETTGLELALNYRIPETNFTPYGSMTILNYRTFDQRTGFKTNHNGTPSIWGLIGLKWETDINDSALFYIDGNAQLSGGAHGESYSAASGRITGSNYRKAWQTANLAFGFEGKTENFKYNTSLSLRNIFDQHYTPIVASPMPEPGFNTVLSFGIEF
ncbi:MAG: TonB-dependent receptor [Candidatus Adiutrix sp.]|jgi:hemoglobin/transferrin/lactoferrin receptor protein|nr:TonB-dependent receptor [Candidatus Adiutrix sp.]